MSVQGCYTCSLCLRPLSHSPALLIYLPSLTSLLLPSYRYHYNPFNISFAQRSSFLSIHSSFRRQHGRMEDLPSINTFVFMISYAINICLNYNPYCLLILTNANSHYVRSSKQLFIKYISFSLQCLIYNAITNVFMLMFPNLTIYSELIFDGISFLI